MSGNGSSSWQSPTEFSKAVRAWPTPRASARENRTTQNAPSHGVTHGKTLAGEAGSWRTFEEDHALIASLLAPEPPKSGHACFSECRRLNPQFVVWLQGFPPGWTSCEPLGTPSYLWWLRTHSERLRAVSELQRPLGW